MNLRLLSLLVTLLLVLTACSGGALIGDSAGDQPTPENEVIDNGLREVPGEPTLAAGARVLSGKDDDAPLPGRLPVPGVDFASNRMIVIFNNQPSPSALAPYLAPGTDAAAVLPTDNAPLVQHPYFRTVSHNLAQAYGVSLFSRVFFKEVNYAVYELEKVEDVAELDALMLRVLNENPGLVSEVAYDYYATLDKIEPVDPVADAEFLKTLRRNPIGLGTAHETANRKASIAAPNDPYYQNRSGSSNSTTGQGTWGLWRMGVTHDQAWNYTTGSSDVVVAVVDTGTRISHEDMVANCIDAANTAPYNEPGIYTDVYYKDNIPNDGHGHGTFCAGEIGAEANNGLGLAGVCWDVSILPIKVLSNGGGGTQSQSAEGMLLANYLGADIISMSLGWDFPTRLQQLAARQCGADDMLVCTSAGNNNNSAPHYPSYYPECFSVGATTLVNSSDNEDFSLTDGALPIDTRYDARTYFSCYGDTVDIAGPGWSTLSVSNSGDSNYEFGWAGTSMSTPYVAGVAALIWSYIDNPTAEKVRGLIMSSATPMPHLYNGADPKGFIDDTTNGHVRFANAYAALQLYDSGPYAPPSVTWDNPTDGATVTGITEIRLGVTLGDGSIVKVEFETANHIISAETAPDTGFYRENWDTAFEFNGPIELIANVYDDKGNITRSSINVIAENSHTVPPYTEDFTGVANDALPSAWTKFDGNTGTTTSWGATDAIGATAAPSMHSSGTTANYVHSSNDWLYAPIVDLTGHASASLTFERRYDRGASDIMYFAVTPNDRDYDYIGWSTTGLNDWSTINYDLSPFAGGEVRLMWILDANNSSSSVAGGLWIDDIEISVATGTAPTITIDTPLNGATVAGMVPVTVTVSDDTVALEIEAVPPVISRLLVTDIPDNDPGPTKTFTFDWDSRHSYRGGALLTVYAYDDENGNGQRDDFVASDSVSLSVDNPAMLASWYDSFETVGVLGGINGSAFDGDWYTWSFGNSQWRINTISANTGDKSAKMGPDGAGNYSNNELDQLYSPVLDISGAVNPYLRVWQQLDVAGDEDDLARIVMVRYDGLDDIETTLTELRSDTSPASTWVAQVFDLKAFQADPLRFNFIFDSNGDGDAGTGWLLDDVEVLDANPVITLISDNARGSAGATRTISGTNFGAVKGTSTVTFAKDGGGTTEATVNAWSGSSIEVVVPADAVSGDVVVTVLGHQSTGYEFRVHLGAPVLDNLNQL